MSKVDELRALREAKQTPQRAKPVKRPTLVKAIVEALHTDKASIGKPKRGRPKVTGERPWEAEGLSRRTWYRRQKEKRG